MAVSPQERLFWGLHVYGCYFCRRGEGKQEPRSRRGVRVSGSRAAYGEAFSEITACTGFRAAGKG